MTSTGESFLQQTSTVDTHVIMNTNSFQDVLTHAAYVGAMSVIRSLGSMNLDNSTQQTEWIMPSGKESDDMLRRQKLTINGQT